MPGDRCQRRSSALHGGSRRGPRRGFVGGLLAGLALTQLPVASAHGASATAGLTRGSGLLFGVVGIAILLGGVVAKRTDRLSPTAALYVVFVGIVVTALGAIVLEGLSPLPGYAASTIPFPRAWYQPMALLTGLAVAVVSLVGGWYRWPGRPRYVFLGVLLASWITYPYLVPGPASDTHPLGYLVVLSTPLLVGYVVWTDAGGVLRAVMHDRGARRFGIGVAVVVALFFTSVTGYLSVFPEEGLPHETTVAVLPAIYQLVSWPTLQVVVPHVPFFLALSPGHVVVVGLLSGLIGLNAAVIARHWRAQERAGMAEGTAGTAAIVGTCTCGCCGPLVAKVAVLAAGPSLAAPIYWVFVDTASPLSAVFIVASLLLFTGSLIYSVESAPRPDESRSVATAD